MQFIVERPFISTWVRNPGGAPDVSSVSKSYEQLARRLPIRHDFARSLLPALFDKSGSPTLTEDDLVIATPKTSNWQEINVYQAYTVKTPNGGKSMFLHIPSLTEWHGLEFRESLMALLDLAETILNCNQLIICLEKERQELASLVHAFMYVGFNIVSPPIANMNSGFVFLGYEI